ncbi:MAG: prepilin-type N-terminal cleavage/methylation protein [Bacteroidetes bacterium]|nr:prepilin-type N-terminal cleavage/methylation protein [Bacteroidota bacterium]
MKLKAKKLKAFTLIELLTVLIIIGILVMIALPNLMPLVSKAKSTEAQLQLEHVYTLEKSYFYLHSKYSTEFSEISYEPAKTVSENGSANYRLEVTQASNNAFKVSATAVTDFDGDGVFNAWEVDQDKNIKEVTPD